MLEVVDVRVAYGENVVIEGVSLTVEEAQTVAILGPSGSGKSTLLRAVAGLEPLASGRVVLDGHDLGTVPVHERHFGLMFQDYVLFPQRDVRGNIAFGLEMRGDERASIEARVDEVLELMGLSGYGTRRTTELSGGEQQRVALARALAPAPRLLMLDEPLGALDRALRARLLDDLAALFITLRLPIIYVTHDQEEAFALAQRVVIMRAGRAAATGTPVDLWTHPVDAWTASFLGFHNIGQAEVRHGIAHTPWGDFPFPAASDGQVTLVLRPDALSLSEIGSIHGSVGARTFHGDHFRVLVDTAPAGVPLELEMRDGALPEPGQSVSIAVDARRVNVLR
jgi:thiamine transport system ATP-binding protein